MSTKPIITEEDWLEQKRWLVHHGYDSVVSYVTDLQIQIERLKDQIDKLEWILAAHKEKK